MHGLWRSATEKSGCAAIKKYKDEEKEIEEQERQRQLLIESKEEEKRELIKVQKKKLARRTKIGVAYALLFLIGGGYCAYFFYKKAEEAKMAEALAQEQLGSSSIIINVKEDDAVRSLWWEAVLEIAVSTEAKDTTYVFKINKSIIKDSAFVVEDKNIKEATISLRYPSEEYKNYEDKTIAVKKTDILRNEPYSISINLRKPFIYGGQVIMSDSLGDFQIENAIVIFSNEVTFTDGQGKFLFQLQEPNDTSEFIVIKKNFTQVLPRLILGDYHRQGDPSEPYKQIVMNLEDPSTYNFVKSLCDSDITWNKKEFDEYKNKNFPDKIMYSKKFNVIYDGIPKSMDWINYYLIFEGNKNGDMKVRGYYYYGDEKKYGYRCVISGHSELHEDSEKLWYRTFELESIDIANNKETIKGKYFTSDEKKNLPWEFNIFIGTKKKGGSVDSSPR